MNLEELSDFIKTDECGFTEKLENVQEYYLVKIRMKEYAYGNQNTFYVLFTNTKLDGDAEELTYNNINTDQYWFNAPIVGIKDETGIFKPLSENFFVGNELTEHKNDQIYVRKFALRTDCIAHVEVVTYEKKSL